MTALLNADLRYLTHVGAETDIIFNRGIDLPEFSLYPFLETENGRALITEYAKAQIAIAAQAGLGTILETATWMANVDRAAALNYDGPALDRINAAAVSLLREASRDAQTPVLISGNLGPRSDAYAPTEQMNADDAAAYHSRQIASLREADLISAYTLPYVAEAIGIARAAQGADMPVVISFTVETDGRLPDGTTLRDAIAQCDAATDAAPLHYMLNCAHPDHFAQMLADGPAMPRLKGVVVNASRCSHAELDEAETLDDGNPAELGQQLATIAAAHSALQVFGGCCGTDARHLHEIATAIA